MSSTTCFFGANIFCNMPWTKIEVPTVMTWPGRDMEESITTFSRPTNQVNRRKSSKEKEVPLQSANLKIRTAWSIVDTQVNGEGTVLRRWCCRLLGLGSDHADQNPGYWSEERNTLHEDIVARDARDRRPRRRQLAGGVALRPLLPGVDPSTDHNSLAHESQPFVIAVEDRFQGRRLWVLGRFDCRRRRRLRLVAAVGDGGFSGCHGDALPRSWRGWRGRRNGGAVGGRRRICVCVYIYIYTGERKEAMEGGLEKEGMRRAWMAGVHEFFALGWFGGKEKDSFFERERQG